MVSAVTYRAGQGGLLTTSVGRGPATTGSIEVGDYFLNHLDATFLARHVLQIAHELEHIQQYREGKTGESHRHEREFLAFAHEALNPALPHTGKVTHKQRVDFIDKAIRLQRDAGVAKRQYADQYQELLRHRDTELRKSGWAHTDPPTEAAL